MISRLQQFHRTAKPSLALAKEGELSLRADSWNA